MPAAIVVLWSKLAAVLDVPNMLDTLHHGRSVDLWALKTFGFEVLVWSTEPDANIWIRTLEQVTDAQAIQLAEQQPELLQVIYQKMGQHWPLRVVVGRSSACRSVPTNALARFTLQ